MSQSIEVKLFSNFAHWDTQSISYSFPISWVGFHTVSNMANLNFFWGVTHCSGSIPKKSLSLLRIHHTEKIAGLRIIIIIVLPVIPVVGCSFKVQWRFTEIRLFLPFSIAVRFVAEGPFVVAIHPHSTIAMVAMNRAACLVDRDQVMVDTKAITLSITVGKESALQHFVG